MDQEVCWSVARIGSVSSRDDWQKQDDDDNMNEMRVEIPQGCLHSFRDRRFTLKKRNFDPTNHLASAENGFFTWHQSELGDVSTGFFMEDETRLTRRSVQG
jgi:hypothetical protein